MCRRITLLLLVIVLLAGCGSRTEQTQQALSSTAAAPGAVGDTGRPATPAADAGAPTVAAPTELPPSPQPSPTTAPPAIATPAPERLKVGAVGFGQERMQVTYVFEVENPNPGLAVETSQYQVAVYDKAGVVLKSDTGYIELLLPAQKFGIAGFTYLDSADRIADHVTVQVKPGRYTATEAQSSFTADKVTYTQGQYGAQVTGIITSPYQQDASNVRVNALAYDSQGALIGGGYTYLNFVPANGQASVEIPVSTAGEPATVQLFASVSGLSAFGGAASNAPGAENIKLGAKGYGQKQESVSYAFLVENPNADVAIENSAYQAAVYAADGAVLASDEGYIEVVLPGQTLGIAGAMTLPAQDLVIDHIEVQVKPGKFAKSEPQPALATDQVVFFAGDYNSRVTGVVTSPYKNDLSLVRANAVAYDDAGQIIGGGVTYVDFLLAGAPTGVVIHTLMSGAPARVELYAAASGLSQFNTPAAPAAPDIRVLAIGFGQDRWQSVHGFLVENRNRANAVEKSQYHVTAFAQDGAVLATESGYIELLLPGQKLGVAGGLSLPATDVAVDHVVVQVKAGNLRPAEQQPTFTADKVAYLKGEMAAKVTGVIQNPYQQDVSQVRVSALVYDAFGAIVGGGFGYLDFVPAEGQAAAEVMVTTRGEPATAELYASLSVLSDLK